MQCARGGGFHANGGVLFSQVHDAQTGTMALLGMGFVGHNFFDELSRERTDGLSPADDARGAPFKMFLVGQRHVFGDGGAAVGDPAAGVRGDALAFEKDFNGSAGEPDFDELAGVAERDTVIVLIDFDVVVDIDAGFFPFSEFVGMSGERLGVWTIDCVEEVAAGFFIFRNRRSLSLVSSSPMARLRSSRL